jgi:hypothetical protein
MPKTTRTAKPLDLKKLKKGDLVAYKNVGYGIISYERGDAVTAIKGGKLYTPTFDSRGMTWDSFANAWVFDGGLGLKTYAILPESVPPGELD